MSVRIEAARSEGHALPGAHGRARGCDEELRERARGDGHRRLALGAAGGGNDRIAIGAGCVGGGEVARLIDGAGGRSRDRPGDAGRRNRVAVSVEHLRREGRAAAGGERGRRGRHSECRRCARVDRHAGRSSHATGARCNRICKGACGRTSGEVACLIDRSGGALYNRPGERSRERVATGVLCNRCILLGGKLVDGRGGRADGDARDRPAGDGDRGLRRPGFPRSL